MGIVVSLNELRFTWPGASTPVLDIMQWSIAAKERVFLHGPSGSGKSTLLSLIGGVLRAQTGTVCVLDQDLGAMSGSARDRYRVDHIGFVFQQFNLIPYLSALENVLLPCRFSRQRAARSASDSAQRLLRALDLPPEMDKQPARLLSVGQQQRVAAARALIGQPELVIADEPTSSLDAERQQGFLTLLMRECATANSALLFVSHDHRLAMGFDRSVDLQSINRAAR